MRLYGYLRKQEEYSEVTVCDSVYDMETYFYNDIDYKTEKDGDLWQKAMMELAHVLTVTEEVSKGRVCVNLSELITKNTDKLKQSDLFYNYDIDDIMNDMDSILAGNVSENWLLKFVACLK